MRFSLVSYTARSSGDNPPKTSSCRVLVCSPRSRINSSSGVTYFMIDTSALLDEGPTSTILFERDDGIPHILYDTVHTVVFRSKYFRSVLCKKGNGWSDEENDE